MESIVNDNLKLTFATDEGTAVISVYEWVTTPAPPHWSEIESGKTWTITDPFTAFNLLVQGEAPGDTELVLTVDPDPGPDRPIGDSLHVIINE